MTDVRAQEEVSLRNLYTDTHACTRLQHHLSRCDPRHMLIAFAAIVIHTSQSHLDNLSHSNHVALRPGGRPGQKNKTKKKRHCPPALASPRCRGSQRLACITPQIALLFCGSLIGFGVVISSTQSEHNDSFNGNHGKLCAQSSYAVHSVRDDDLLRCINMVSASRWQSNRRSVHVGYQASLVY